MWLDDPAKMAQFGYSNKNSITPERVADDMYSLVTEGKYPGGTCLQSSVSGVRTLGTWNIAPPASVGTSVPLEVIERNNAPMREIMKKERGLLTNGK